MGTFVADFGLDGEHGGEGVPRRRSSATELRGVAARGGRGQDRVERGAGGDRGSAPRQRVRTAPLSGIGALSSLWAGVVGDAAPESPGTGTRTDSDSGGMPDPARSRPASPSGQLTGGSTSDVGHSGYGTAHGPPARGTREAPASRNHVRPATPAPEPADSHPGAQDDAPPRGTRGPMPTPSPTPPLAGRMHAKLRHAESSSGTDSEDDGAMWFGRGSASSSPAASSASSPRAKPPQPEPADDLDRRPISKLAAPELSPRRTASAYSLSKKDLPPWNRRDRVRDSSPSDGSSPRRSSSFTFSPDRKQPAQGQANARSPAARVLFPDPGPRRSPPTPPTLTSRIGSLVGRALFLDDTLPPPSGGSPSHPHLPLPTTPPLHAARQPGRRYAPRTPSPSLPREGEIPEDYDPNLLWDGPAPPPAPRAPREPLTPIAALDSLLVLNATVLAALAVVGITLLSYLLSATDAVLPALKSGSGHVLDAVGGVGRTVVPGLRRVGRALGGLGVVSRGGGGRVAGEGEREVREVSREGVGM